MSFKSELEARRERELANKERLHQQQKERIEPQKPYSFKDAVSDWVKLYYNKRFAVNVMDDSVEALNYRFRLEMTLNLMRNYQRLKEQGKLNLGFVEHIKEGVHYHFPTDYRDYTEERGFYSLQFLVFVIMLAKHSGRNSAAEIVSFYREHYLEFFIMVPDVPPFRYSLSETTVKTAIAGLKPDMLKELFSEFFLTAYEETFPISRSYGEGHLCLRWSGYEQYLP